MSQFHDFKDRLKFSEAHDAFWERCYRLWFPEFSGMISLKGSNLGQRRGLDRIILCTDGGIVRVQEKAREKWYGDFLLETISVDSTIPPKAGWADLKLEVDYFAYGIPSEGRAFLFPYALFRLTWLRNRERWLATYPQKPSRNQDYQTWNVFIPRDELFAEIRKSMCLELTEACYREARNCEAVRSERYRC